jgi:hypothetical protein
MCETLSISEVSENRFLARLDFEAIFEELGIPRVIMI